MTLGEFLQTCGGRMTMCIRTEDGDSVVAKTDETTMYDDYIVTNWHVCDVNNIDIEVA